MGMFDILGDKQSTQTLSSLITGSGSETNYGSQPETDQSDKLTLDSPGVGPTLSDDIVTDRAKRADYALGDKSPGVQSLKDQFKSQGEAPTRLQASADADAEFRQDKLDVIKQASQSQAPISADHINTLMAIGTTPDANPNTVFEDKFGKNIVNAGVIGDPGTNLVFQSAFDTNPDETRTGIQTASAAVSRKQQAKGLLEETQSARDALPWVNTDANQVDQQDKLGDMAKSILSGGISSYVNQHNLLTASPAGTFLPGNNKLEQIQYLYLLPQDQFLPTLRAAVGPGSELFKKSPGDALDFAKAAVQFSSSDAYVDNVFAVQNVASLIPVGAFGNAIRKTLSMGRVADQGLTTAARAAEDVLKASPKRPVTPGETAQQSVQDILNQSSAPPPQGYYVPEAAITRPTPAATKKSGRGTSVDFTSQVDQNGVPSIYDKDGIQVQLSRTPEVGHRQVNVSPGEGKPNYSTPEGTFPYETAEGETRVNDQKTIFVNKSDWEKLSQSLDENINPRILQNEKGGYYVNDKNVSPEGKPLPSSTVPASRISNTPQEGLYPVHLPEGNDGITAANFPRRIHRVDDGASHTVTLGPKIAADGDVETRVALADIVKSQGESHPQDVLTKMGQQEAAATIGAQEILTNRFNQVIQTGDVEAIRRNIPSLDSPQVYYQNSSSLSSKRARELADQAIATSSELGNAIVNSARLERLTAEALNRALDEAKAVVPTKFNRASDAILDQATVWDSDSNTYKVVTKIGKKDMTLFDTSVQAKHFKDFQYRIGSSATVEQEGNKFYIAHTQHADETKAGVRDGLIVTGNETPRSFFNTLLTAITGKINPIGNNIRSSAYTVSEFQRNNRVVATHASSTMRQAIEDTAQDIQKLGGSWTTNERHEMQQILETNRDYMQPDGQRGQFYKSALEFETAFQDKFKKLPTEKQVVAYDQFTRLSDLDWVLRELDWHRDKARQGIRNYRLTIPGKDEMGLPSSSKTGWFNAKEVPGIDHVNTENANVYIAPDGRMTTKYDMRNPTLQDLNVNKKIKEGQYKVLQVYNPQSKPLREGTSIKDNIHFIVTDKFEDKGLVWGENSVYRPGGHVIYLDQNFMKQPQIGQGTLGRMTHFGDTTMKSFAGEKEGNFWVDKYNQARELLHNNDEDGLKAFIDAGNLPETLPEFKKLFTGAGPGGGLSTEHPFVLTKTGRSTFDSSEALQKQYPGLKDQFSSYDLSKSQDSKFLGERDQQLNTIESRGTETNPYYVNVPSRLMDPYTALQKGVAQIVRSRWMGDYKLSAAESWIQEFGLLFPQNTLPLDKLRQNPVYWLSHAEGNIDLSVARNNPALVAAAMTSRKNILNFIGARDEVGALMDGLERKVIAGIESIGGAKLAQKVEETYLPFIKDAPSYARAGAFHSVIGMFNPIQLFQQAQGLTHVLALSPMNGLKGTTASALVRLYRYSEDPAILSSMADKAAALGWNRDNYIEAYNAWQASGTHRIGGEAALLNQVGDPQLFRNGFQSFLDKGQLFFKAGESIVRDTAFFTAYQDWRAINPTAKLGNREMGDISRRFDTLSMNMTRASNSALNEGLLSPATQFWTWNARFTEQMLGKQLTVGEKARAFAMYSAMYGIPSTLGGITWGLIPDTNFADIRQYAMANNYNLNDKFFQAFSKGLPEMILNGITGHETDLHRFSPDATMLRDITDGKKSIAETLGGASAGFTENIAKTLWPAMMYGYSAIKGDSKFPLKMNDLTNLAENVSSFSNAEKAIVGLNLGKMISKSEMYVTDVDSFDSVMLGLGLSPTRASDAYLKLDYLKNLKSMQEKVSKNMTEDWKIGMAAGQRGDFQTMADYMTRVRAWTAAGGFTHKQELQIFKEATRGNEDMVTGAEKQWREKIQSLQSIPQMQQYLDNQKKN